MKFLSLLSPSDEWESDEDDDDGEWVDIYHSSDEEGEVQIFLFKFVGLILPFFDLHFCVATIPRSSKAKPISQY